MFIPLQDQNSLKSVRLQFVTLAMIAINVIVWLVMATPQLTADGQLGAVFYSYGFIPAVVHNTTELPAELVVIPETASYITYAFLHGGFMHLAGNMLFLWVFGDNVEDAMGHIKFLLFYLLCAAAGAFAHSWVDPSSKVPL
ncbi:MAG: rhomboid family intramembrane serine protease, partial [Pseudomonadota bacterium]